MMDLSREEVTMMSELSIGVAMAVTMSVWARIVPFSTSPSAMVRFLGDSSKMAYRSERERGGDLVK